MITGRRILTLLIFIGLLQLAAGCSDHATGSVAEGGLLKEDAIKGLRGALFEDYTRLTVIRGSLYKYSMDVTKTHYLGITIGALQSMVFTQEYDYDRFTRQENISPDMKKEIIAQPLLNIIIKNRDLLTHAHSDILDPILKQVDAGMAVTPEQVGTLNELVRILDRMVAEYATLSKPELDFNGKEAEDAFFRLQDYQKDLQKLTLPTHQ